MPASMPLTRCEFRTVHRPVSATQFSYISKQFALEVGDSISYILLKILEK
jgi:hypothetical protein